MSYAYQPKDPRQKLRQVVQRYVSQMQVMGVGPNCGIVFERPGETPSQPDTIGWVFDDARPDGTEVRYVVLRDGDVWHEAAVAAENANGRSWLDAPNDDVVMLLARWVTGAHTKGASIGARACTPDRPLLVSDRRTEQSPHTEHERRTHD
jgi:hypothetical protein